MARVMTYEKIKTYYQNGLWQEFQVKKMVEIGTLTSEQYTEMTGTEYVTTEISQSDRIEANTDYLVMMLEV